MQAMWLYNWLQLRVIENVIAEWHCKRHTYKPGIVNMLNIKEAAITNNKHTDCKQNSWTQILLCFQQNKLQQCTG